VVAEVLAFEAFEFFVLRRRYTEGGLGDFGGEDGIVPRLLDAAVLQLIGQLFTNRNRADSLFDPVVGIALGLVQDAGALGGEFRVFDFLNTLVANLGQPSLKGFGLSAGNRLDYTKGVFGIDNIRCVHFPV